MGCHQANVAEQAARRSTGRRPACPDAIYSVSVFTHLSEDFHRAWQGELLRVVRAGGIMMTTVHSPIRH